MSLVKLIQHDCIDAPQIWVGGKASCQNALGNKSQASARTSDFIKSHLVADCFSDPLTHFRRNSPCGHPYRDAAWLEHDHFTRYEPKELGRNAGGLASAW